MSLRSFYRCRVLVFVLAWVGSFLASVHGVSAERIMPDAALLPNFNPLCDSSLVHCLEIDDFAAHAYAHLQVLPKTDRRDTAAVFPFGVTMGLFGRFAGGISTSYSFWNEGDGVYHQLGPLRLSLTGRLLPLFPLFSSGGDSETNEEGESHYAPPRGFRLGLSYEHEVRVGPFDGANSLGFLTDLAMLRIVGSKMLGPFQLSASLGALYDWRGAFATSEVAAQLGLYLPFFEALKIYGEAMVRGVPTHVRSGEDLLHPQGVVGLGFSFHPHARIDLGVSIQRGFGGIAPWVASVNFLTLSVGKTYQGRAATPLAQMAGDAAAEAASALKEFIASLPIDPKLDENCLILDDDGSVMGKFGKKTLSGYYCEQDGFRVPIGHELLRDKRADRLCRGTEKNPQTGKSELTDCLLQKNGNEWIPIHEPRLDGTCRMTDSDGTVLGQMGTPTDDGQHCRVAAEKKNGSYGTYTKDQLLPIGQPFHTDADRTAVCLTPTMQDCFMKPQSGRHTLAWGDGAPPAIAYIDGLESKVADGVDAVKEKAHTVEDVATGKVKATTIYEEGKRAAEQAYTNIDGVMNSIDKRKAATDALVAKVEELRQSAKDFWKKPPEDRMEAAAGALGRGTVSVGTGMLIGGGTRIVGEMAGAAVEGVRAERAIVKGGSKATKLAEAAEHRRPTLSPKPTGRGKNHLHPNTKADGPHSTFRRDQAGELTHHAEWKPNPQQPDTGFDEVKRVDLVGEGHENKKTNQSILTPHTHDKATPGGIRDATPDELPMRMRSNP